MNNVKMHKILWAKGLAKFFLILPVSILIGLSACNKSSIVGLEIQPENDLINAEFLDSLTLLTQTFKEDTLRTDVNIGYSGIGLIGKYIDPIFGEATSSLYTQLRMYSSAPVFGSNPLCDSVKLTLYYIDAYGELTKHQQTINVYHLIGDIDINANYFSNQTIAASSIDLANGYVFTPQPSDSIEIKGVKQAPQLRVPLEKSFGQDILNQQYTTNLANNTEFVKYIKGLYITTEKTQGLMSGQGSILRFNLNYSSVDIYYKYRPLNAVKDSATQYSIRLGSVASLSNFSHNYLSALPDLKNQIAAGITPAQNENIYVQSMAGLKAKIKIPHLLEWAKKDLIAVHKAEIILKPINPKTSPFAIPPALSLYGIQDDGQGMFLLPDAIEGGPEDRGTYDTLSKTYHFTITRYIQFLVAEKLHNNGLSLKVSNPITTPNRVVLGGGAKDNNPYQMKLNITYTKLK